MRKKLRTSQGFQDPKVNELAKDISAGFASVLESTVYKVETLWNPPFTLLVPFLGGEKRLNPPDFVVCQRARNLTDPSVLVTPAGGTSFEWVGDGRVRIDAISGLTAGVKYELTLNVVGE